MKEQTLSNGLSFEMPAGKLFSTETAPPDSVPESQLFQLPVIDISSYGKPATKGKRFLSALFG